jgi:hypothetical protein
MSPSQIEELQNRVDKATTSLRTSNYFFKSVLLAIVVLMLGIVVLDSLDAFYKKRAESVKIKK